MKTLTIRATSRVWDTVVMLVENEIETLENSSWTEWDFENEEDQKAHIAALIYFLEQVT